MQGEPVPAPRPGEQQWWDEAFTTWWWLEKFGLTPARVRAEIPVRDLDRVPQIAAMMDKLRADAEKAAARG